MLQIKPQDVPKVESSGVVPRRHIMMPNFVQQFTLTVRYSLSNTTGTNETSTSRGETNEEFLPFVVKPLKEIESSVNKLGIYSKEFVKDLMEGLEDSSV